MKWSLHDKGEWFQVVDEKGAIVFETVAKNRDETAAARAISAAPDMLALLKTSRRNLSSIIAACNCNTYDPWLAEMDRVIALAEGGES